MPSDAARRDRSQDQRSELERFMATAPRMPLVIPAEGAKVLVVKFNDYQCPACGQSYPAVQADLREVRGDASRRGQARDEGLSAQPRLQLRTSRQMIHPAACEAAVAVRLAKEHNRGAAMEEWLYTHQPA